MSYFYEGLDTTSPSVCFLLGGNIGEVIVLKDVGSSFTVTRSQVCTGLI